MKKSEKNEELQSRREFLKKTAKGALPILGISLFGPSIFTACKKDEKNENSSSYNVGDRVNHKIFGVGVVTRIDGSVMYVALLNQCIKVMFAIAVTLKS